MDRCTGCKDITKITLYHTIVTFSNPGNVAFLKTLLEKEKMVVTILLALCKMNIVSILGVILTSKQSDISVLKPI